MSCKCRKIDNKKEFKKENQKSTIFFKDKIFLKKSIFLDSDVSETKTLISIRDGFQEYLGIELGLEPSDKVFKVYRSPQAIKEIKDKLIGLAVIENHIEPIGKIENELIVGKILSSEIISNKEEETDSTIAIKNEISIDTNKLQFDHEQLSLGYTASMQKCPSGKYDLIQTEIKPHHLAIVEAGRCGDTCEFKDEQIKIGKEQKMTVEEILEVVKQFLQNGSDEDKAKLKTLLVKDDEAEKEVTDEDEDDVKTSDEETDEEKKEVTDEDEEEKTKVTDKAMKKVLTSDAFNKILNKRVEERLETIEKAKAFLDSKYPFSKKDTKQIMRDVLNVEYRGTNFKDNEIPLAFKLLEVKEPNYSRLENVKTVDSAGLNETIEFFKKEI